MRFADVFIRRPVFATMLIASLVVLGLFSYRSLGLDLFPNIDFPIVTVTTTLKGASVEEMETGVTKVIEEAVNTIDGIDELHGLLAVQPGERARLDDAVLGRADVPHPQRPLAAARHDEVAEIGGPLDAAHGAHHQLAARLVEPAAGQLEVLPLDRVAHLADRQALRRQPVRVDGDVDGAFLAAEHEHLPDPGERLDVLLHLPAGELGLLAQVPPPGERDAHDGDGVHVELVDDRRVGPDGQLGEDGGHLVPHVLGRGVA